MCIESMTVWRPSSSTIILFEVVIFWLLKSTQRLRRTQSNLVILTWLNIGLWIIELTCYYKGFTKKVIDYLLNMFLSQILLNWYSFLLKLKIRVVWVIFSLKYHKSLKLLNLCVRFVNSLNFFVVKNMGIKIAFVY